MPELPEVETVVRELRPRIAGRRIASVRVGRRRLRSPWKRSWGSQLAGRRIEALHRRGKWIVAALEGGARLVLHLGMTGQLRVVPADRPPAPHTHLVLRLGPGALELRFRDVRRFGSATLFPTAREADDFFLAASLGPEPFELNPNDWRRRLASTRRCLKAVLLDQRVLAGVGNIYADEALFEACLHPARPARMIRPTEAERLRKAVAAVLARAIDRRGSTIRDYVGGSGQEGSFQRELRVYGRTGQPCPRCHAPVQRVRLAGRSTHFCARCQPALALTAPSGSRWARP